MIYVVLDTNIIISSLLFGGKPRAIFQLVIDEKIRACISPYILFETKEILYKKFGFSTIDLDRIEESIQEAFILVHPKNTIRKIKVCKADNHILECAVEARADYLVTGDKKHILPLKKIKRTRIITAEEFLHEYAKFS